MNRHVECPKRSVRYLSGPEERKGSGLSVPIHLLHNCNANLDITGPSEDSNRYGDWLGTDTTASYRLSRLLDW